MSAQIYYSEKKLRDLSPGANYTDWEIAACRRSKCQVLRIEGVAWSALFCVILGVIYFRCPLQLVHKLNYTPTTLGEQSWRLITSGVSKRESQVTRQTRGVLQTSTTIPQCSVSPLVTRGIVWDCRRELAYCLNQRDMNTPVANVGLYIHSPVITTSTHS
jgi:hypothetical protein